MRMEYVRFALLGLVYAQRPRRTLMVEGKQHPDRIAQFEHINAKAASCIERGVPFISVDTKKK